MTKIVVGRISKLFGSSGELMATLYDTFPADWKGEKPVYAVVDGLDVPLFFSRLDRRGKSSAVVMFDDIDNERRAAEFVGKEFFIQGVAQEEQQDDDQIYMEDLVGFRAILDGGVEGEITDYIESDLNPLLEITIAGKPSLIPAADDFITRLDERRRRIWLSLPEGLLTLND